MSTKTKNTIIIAIILVGILLAAGFYDFIYQKGKISDRTQKLKDLKLYQFDTDALNLQLTASKERIAQLDSILANRKYVIPVNISQANFFDFV
ncbi:MAG: hypothetical protein Q8S39_15335, partial [Ignavibacteria bacterium]|nr:hypothetical protein [Ignavibacteria bacterium]